MTDNMKYLILFAFAVLLIVLGPVLIIWSLNTLFPVLAIPYTLETWVAAFFISGAFGSLVKTSFNSVK